MLHIDPQQVVGGHPQVGGILTADVTPRSVACSTVPHEFRWLARNAVGLVIGLVDLSV